MLMYVLGDSHLYTTHIYINYPTVIVNARLQLTFVVATAVQVFVAVVDIIVEFLILRKNKFCG